MYPQLKHNLIDDLCSEYKYPLLKENWLSITDNVDLFITDNVDLLITDNVNLSIDDS